MSIINHINYHPLSMKTKRNKHITNHRQSSIKLYGRTRSKKSANPGNKTRAKPSKIKTRKRVVLTGGGYTNANPPPVLRASKPLFLTVSQNEPKIEPPEVPSRNLKPGSAAGQQLFQQQTHNLGIGPLSVATTLPPPRPPKASSLATVQSVVTSPTQLGIGSTPPPRPKGPKPSRPPSTVPSQSQPNPINQSTKYSIPIPPPFTSVVKSNFQLSAPPLPPTALSPPIKPPPPAPPLPSPSMGAVNPNPTKPALVSQPPPAPPMPPSGKLPVPKQSTQGQGPGKPAGNKPNTGKQHTGRNAFLRQIEGGVKLRTVEPKKGSNNPNVVNQQVDKPVSNHWALMASVSKAITALRQRHGPNNNTSMKKAEPKEENEWE